MSLSSATMGPSRDFLSRHARGAVLTIGLCWLCLVVGRFLGPQDFVDHDHQERQAAYVLDLLRNGHWVMQENQVTELAGKPPLYTWLAAATAPFTGGRLTVVGLYVPAALSLLVSALILYAWGRRCLGRWAGLLAAVFFMLSPSGAKMVWLARIDGLFTCLVLLTLYLGFRAWESGRGGLWLGFWLAATAATLAKGPLGLLLGALGLLAAVWERWRPGPRPSEPGKNGDSPAAATGRAAWGHLTGIALYLLLCGGWFLLAWQRWGHPFIARVIFAELLGHADMVGTEAKDRGIHVVLDHSKAFIYLVARFLPWSLLGAVGIWRAFRRPAAAAGERRFERFLTCAVVAGLVVFTLTIHQRADLLFPLMPPLSLLAAREVVRWWQPERRPRAMRVLIVGMIVLGLGLLTYEWGLGRKADRKNLADTRGVLQVYKTLRAIYGDHLPPIIHTTHAAVGFQLLLNTMKITINPAVAAQRLAGPDSLLVATTGSNNDLADFLAAIPKGVHAYKIVPWPLQGKERNKHFLVIYGNRPPPGNAKPAPID